MDIAYFIENFNEEKKQEMIKVDKCWYVGANMEGVDYFDEFVKMDIGRMDMKINI